MIGIEEIGSYLPEDYIDNHQRKEIFDTTDLFIKEKLGFQQLRRKQKEEETSDLCVKAFYNLQTKVDIKKEEIDCLILCTQTPDEKGIPQASAILHEKLGLPTSVASFDISLGCSGYVYGLSIAKTFMEANQLKKGLLFTGEAYSKILDPKDRNTELLFADGATVTLLSENFRYKILHSEFSTAGNQGKHLAREGKEGLLRMNGRGVFSFVSKNVPQQVKQCCDKNKLPLEKIDLFLFHQGSKFIVDNLRNSLKLPQDKVPFAAQKTGNLVSSSIPHLLKDQLNKNLTFLLLSGFGIGLSSATTIIEKNNRK